MQGVGCSVWGVGGGSRVAREEPPHARVDERVATGRGREDMYVNSIERRLMMKVRYDSGNLTYCPRGDRPCPRRRARRHWGRSRRRGQQGRRPETMPMTAPHHLFQGGLVSKAHRRVYYSTLRGGFEERGSKGDGRRRCPCLRNYSEKGS